MPCAWALVDEVHERALPAEARVDLARHDGPVAVEAGRLVDSVGGDPRVGRVRVVGAQPEDIDAELVERAVVDLRLDALVVASLELLARVHVWQRRDIVSGVAVLEAVGHRHVDDGVLPGEGGRLDPEHEAQHRRRLTRVQSEGVDVGGVLAVGEAREV